MKTITKNVENLYHVNIYETYEGFDGEDDYIDILDVVVEAEDKEDGDDIMNYYCNLYRENIGYTVCVTWMFDIERYSGFKKIKKANTGNTLFEIKDKDLLGI